MAAQSYSNHRRFVPAFHFFLIPLLLYTLIAATRGFLRAFDDPTRFHSALLMLLMAIALVVLAFLARVFALKAQDRAIRAEENLRHYVLTGKLLDKRLTALQIVGLRFASDEEFPALAQRAATESLSGNTIKKAVKNWRPDTYRV